MESDKGDPDAPIAEIAHIKGEKPGSPRYNSSMTDKERNSAGNLLVLCPTCHTLIDTQPLKYTAEKLYQIKEDHENWVRDRTSKEAINVTFSELDVVTKYLVSSELAPNGSLTIIPPREKMRRNYLTSVSEKNIMIGYVQVDQVSKFVENCPDPHFGEHLRKGFVTEYEKLKNKEELVGDDLFDSLFEFASKGSENFRYRAAGLSVLVYLFEKCEVFEK